MRQSRDAESSVKLLSHGAAANHLAALQHNRLESAFGEVERGDQSIVTTADYRYLLSERHRQFLACADRELVTFAREEFLPPAPDADPPFQSFRITWLAMRPGAAMIPPPGCVADPHIYRPSIGVL